MFCGWYLFVSISLAGACLENGKGKPRSLCPSIPRSLPCECPGCPSTHSGLSAALSCLANAFASLQNEGKAGNRRALGTLHLPCPCTWLSCSLPDLWVLPPVNFIPQPLCLLFASSSCWLLSLLPENTKTI